MTEDTVLVIQLMAMIVFGVIGSARMKSVGRSGVLGFGLGATFGVLGLLIVWRISKPASSEIRDSRTGLDVAGDGGRVVI